MSTATNKSLFILPLGRTLAHLAKSYFGALTKKLETLDIDRHFSVLILMEDAENEEKDFCQQNIADMLNIDKVTMVRMVDYLIKSKYIVKELNPADRREYFLKLTGKAKKELPRIHDAINNLNKTIFKGLNKNEIDIFYKSIDIVENNLKEVPSDEVVFKFRKAKKS